MTDTPSPWILALVLVTHGSHIRALFCAPTFFSFSRVFLLSRLLFLTYSLACHFNLHLSCYFTATFTSLVFSLQPSPRLSFHSNRHLACLFTPTFLDFSLQPSPRQWKQESESLMRVPSQSARNGGRTENGWSCCRWYRRTTAPTKYVRYLTGPRTL
jgi:hypothetical protein